MDSKREPAENIIGYKGKCAALKTEFQDKYVVPEKDVKEKTEEERLEEFFWHEFYDEYLRYMHRQNEIPKEELKTEYGDEFCKISAADHDKKVEEIISKHPIYAASSRPITLWGMVRGTDNFKIVSKIGKPLSEVYDRQWLD